MAGQIAHTRGVQSLARGQHGLVARRQLLALGYSRHAIAHRVARGRLFVVRPGVYAVGRREITREGELMAAVLSCEGSALSHVSAAEHYGILDRWYGPVHLSLPYPRSASGDGLRVHRRRGLRPEDRTEHDGIPVTSIVCTLVDLATMLSTPRLVRAINQADGLGLIDPQRLRRALDQTRRRGAGGLRKLLDRQTFRLTRSALEDMFLPLVARAGLAPPQTMQMVNGFEVDFYWPQLGLVVETDSLRHHRTAAQQQRDLLRDQAHAKAGLTPLRFSHSQIAFDTDYVVETLARVGRQVLQYA
jgi:very-short-patch-repair endonuclease